MAGPWRITFDTNPDDCNMHCIMCEEHSDYSPLKKERALGGRKPRRMDIEIIRNTVREMIHYGLKEIIPSTMGEPLLFAHFLDIIDICKEYGVKLNLTTNGTWSKYGAEEWARLICPVASDVKISWNGSTAAVQESIMRGSSFEKRLEDLRKFVKIRDNIAKSGGNRCTITLQITFMENNVQELPDIVKLAMELGLDRVKGHQLWVHFPEIRSLDLRKSKESIDKWNKTVDRCHDIVKVYNQKTGAILKLDNFYKLHKDETGIMPLSWECPFLGKEAWINTEGRFDPCCAPDAERRGLGDFGKLSIGGGFPEIWFGKKYQELRSHYMDYPVCKKCTMRRPVREERKIEN